MYHIIWCYVRLYTTCLFLDLVNCHHGAEGVCKLVQGHLHDGLGLCARDVTICNRARQRIVARDSTESSIDVPPMASLARRTS